MAPSTRTVLSCRWGLSGAIRLGAVGLLGWTIWTYLPLLVEQMVFVPLNGRVPFYWLDESVGLSGSMRIQRQRFLVLLKSDAVVCAVAVALFLLSGRIGVLVVRFPRALRRCPTCGYSLASLARPRCPECGLDLEGVVAVEADRVGGEVATPAVAEPHPSAGSESA